jgi:hypothetical protein
MSADFAFSGLVGAALGMEERIAKLGRGEAGMTECTPP